MGQKIHPRLFRTGVLYNWSSKWFADRDYSKFLQQDIRLKEFLIKKFKDASVADIEIERSPRSVTVIIHSAKPGMIIGRGGQGIEDLKKQIKQQYIRGKINLTLTIQEVTDPGTSAELIAQTIVADVEKRIPYRRAMKQAIFRLERAGVKGVKIQLAGRLNGAEISRSEMLNRGSMPLHTLRADIDYALRVAHTTYGTIGVKVWVFKGHKFGESPEAAAPARPNRKK